MKKLLYLLLKVFRSKIMIMDRLGNTAAITDVEIDNFRKRTYIIIHTNF